MVEINWTRWFIYLVVVFLTHLAPLHQRTTCSGCSRCSEILVFVEGLFTWRRTSSRSAGPSVIFVYVALMGLYLQRGRFPSLGAQGFLWLAFLFAASIGVMMGSLGTGLLLLNIKYFQEYYLEGAFYFLVGMMAFDRDEDVNRFLYWLVVLIGGGAAALHLLFLVIGWRPPGFAETGVEIGSVEFIGGAFPHSNTQADFLAMVLPIDPSPLAREIGGANRFLVGAGCGDDDLASARGGRGGILSRPYWLESPSSSPARDWADCADLAGRGSRSQARRWSVSTSFLAYSRRSAIWRKRARDIASGPGPVPAHVCRQSLGVGLPPAQHLCHRQSLRHQVSRQRAYLSGHRGQTGFRGYSRSWRWWVQRSAPGGCCARADPQARQATLFLFLAICGFLLGGSLEPIYDNGTG
jgi:hypothetical protein